jgi:hypothetical protein
MPKPKTNPLTIQSHTERIPPQVFVYAYGWLPKNSKDFMFNYDAYAAANGYQSDLYLTVNNAQIYPKKLRGKGYGHQLYFRLAQTAARLGFKGIRSHQRNRNEYSNKAWKKIRTHTRNGWCYLNWEMHKRNKHTKATA